jgi:hypothetical protein
MVPYRYVDFLCTTYIRIQTGGGEGGGGGDSIFVFPFQRSELLLNNQNLGTFELL